MLRRVLLVDDDPAVLRSLTQALGHLGVEPESAASAEEALARIAEYPPDLVLSDIRMPGLDGVGLLALVRERAPSVDVVLMTAYDDMTTVVRSMREGAFDFLVKPIDPGELEALTQLHIHPDGRRLAFVAGIRSAELWVMGDFLPGSR